MSAGNGKVDQFAFETEPPKKKTKTSIVHMTCCLVDTWCSPCVRVLPVALFAECHFGHKAIPGSILWGDVKFPRLKI